MAPGIIHYMPRERAVAARLVAACGQRCDSASWSTLVDGVSCPECLLIGASLARNAMSSSVEALMSFDEGRRHFDRSDPTTNGAAHARRLEGLAKLTQPQGDDGEKDERRPHVVNEEAVVVVETLSEPAA